MKVQREKICLALWPTPEAENDIKEKMLCQEIEYSCLQDTV